MASSFYNTDSGSIYRYADVCVSPGGLDLLLVQPVKSWDMAGRGETQLLSCYLSLSSLGFFKIDVLFSFVAIVNYSLLRSEAI